jgi:hypothetical protein
LRKAQGGLNAAILVAVIGGLIILYILFLPEDERESFLENKTIDKIRGNDNDDDKDVLLREFPGRLNTVQDVEDKDIPSVFLFESTNAKTLERINPFIVRSGVFDKERERRAVSFALDDLENTNNVLLSFRTKKNEGLLAIKLNGNIIFENDIESETVTPIKLRRNFLDDTNTLEFGVSSVGYRFWKTNEYIFEDIKIVGDITDKSKQESRNVFTLTEDELSNIDKADLRFVPYCGNVADVGVLDIFINNRNVFSAVPVCEDPYRQPLPLGILNRGENRIVLKTNKGSYSVEQIKIEFEEDEIETDVFFFEINQTTLDRFEEEEEDPILRIEFVDDDKTKKADLNINNRLSSIDLDRDESVFIKNINDSIKKGNNFIEIRPRTRLNIIEIRVKIEES